MDKAFSFCFDFDFEETDLDESLLQEIDSKINNTNSFSCDDSSIFQSKGEIKSQDREKFKNEFDSIRNIRSRASTNFLKVVDTKTHNFDKKMSLSQEIKHMLGQLAKINKNSKKVICNIEELSSPQNLESNNQTSFCSSNSNMLAFKSKHETQEAKRCSIFTFKNADCEVDIN